MGKERKSAVPIVIVAATPLLLLVLYIVSFGPAYGLMQHGRINYTLFDTFYYPLIVAAKNVPWIERALHDYGSLFL